MAYHICPTCKGHKVFPYDNIGDDESDSMPNNTCPTCQGKGVYNDEVTETIFDESKTSE